MTVTTQISDIDSIMGRLLVYMGAVKPAYNLGLVIFGGTRMVTYSIRVDQRPLPCECADVVDCVYAADGIACGN